MKRAGGYAVGTDDVLILLMSAAQTLVRRCPTWIAGRFQKGPKKASKGASSCPILGKNP